MPITSYTGLPGHGKTALMMEHLMQAGKKGDRPIWASGIDGLKPGLANEFKDPRDWNAHDDNAPEAAKVCDCHQNGELHAHLIPDGSLIFVDEVWKWFGHLHDATRQATPKHVLSLAEHRHRGIDFVWTFQQPNQIYPFARGLMAEHHHVVRRFGTQFIDVFTWSELNEDVKSLAKREAAQRKTRTLPSESFDAYKSAEIHTIKSKVPWKVMMIPLLLVAAVLAGWFAYDRLKPDKFAQTMTGAATKSAVGASAQDLSPGTKSTATAAPRYASAYEYAKVHLPRIGVMPWTAELYDEREFTADPELFCLSSMPGRNGAGEWTDEPTCTCLTEQGTAYDLSQPECRTIARRGPVYNPYRAGNGQRDREGVQGSPPAAMGAPAPASQASTVIPGDMKAVEGAGPRTGVQSAP